MATFTTASPELTETGGTTIASTLSEEEQKRIENRAKQPPETPKLDEVLPSAEEMDLETSLLPSSVKVEVAPSTTEQVSVHKGTAALAEKALERSTATPETPQPARRARDHGTGQHAGGVHATPAGQPRGTGKRPPSSRKLDQQIKRLEDILDATDPALKAANAASSEKSVKETPPPEVVAKKQSYKEFEAQQNEIWGANDNIKPEDIPEGEMTWEQYLARRQAATQGDVMHHGGRTYEATTGRIVSHKGYEATQESKPAREHYSALADEAAYAEALADNKEFDRQAGETIRNITEGEFIVKKDAKLSTILEMGEELLALQNKKMSRAKAEKIAPALEQKGGVINDLLELQLSKGADPRAIDYIRNKILRPYESGGDKPLEGKPQYNGEQVKILEFTETPRGGKLYDIELPDGSTETVFSHQVSFEAARPEAPKEPRGLERITAWFKKEGNMIKAYGGMAYWKARWQDPLMQRLKNATIDHGVKELMTEEEKNERRKRNVRIATIAGVGVLSAAAIGFGIAGIAHSLDSASAQDALGSLPSGGTDPHDVNREFWANHDFSGGAGETSGVEQLPFVDANVDATPPPVEVAPPIPTDVFNIPSGQGGEALFRNAGLDPARWYQYEDTLLAQFPGDFYRMDSGHVGIAHSGWLSQGAQNFINSLR